MPRSFLRQLLPAPLLSIVLFFVWLLLNGTVEPAHLLLAALLAVAIPLWTARLVPERMRPLAWGPVLRLLVIVPWDVVTSTFVVARQVLGPENRLNSCFIRVPVSIRNPHGLFMLATIVSLTPGTLMADISRDRKHLLVHALHLEDESALIELIQQRYERPLQQIFDGNDGQEPEETAR